MELEIRKTLSLAVHVKDSRSGGNAYEGQVNNINCTTMIGPSPPNCSNWTEMAFFNRESSTGGLDGLAEQELLPTWFWYKGPVHTGNKFQSQSGVFVIDSGGNATGPDTARSGAPGADDTYFDQLTEFQMETVNDVGRGIQRVKVRAKFRYHGVTEVRTWCPKNDIDNGDCVFASGQQANYYDSEYNFNVTLTNNFIRANAGDGTATEVRALGPIHFFRPIYPSGEF